MASSCASERTVRAARAEALDALVREIKACRICRETSTGNVLPHEPRPVLRVSATAKLIVAGQAPGTRVHQSGVPFTDPSGDRLREWMGVSLAEFYDAARIAIVPMGFCFPGLDANGGDLPPRKECAPNWRARVLSAMPQVELILAVGQYAHWWHIPGKRQPVTETVRTSSNELVAGTMQTEGAPRLRSRQSPSKRRTPAEPSTNALRPAVIALPHPSWRNNAWLKANTWFEADLLPLLRSEVRRLIA